jgi:hypothetical protein
MKTLFLTLSFLALGTSAFAGGAGEHVTSENWDGFAPSDAEESAPQAQKPKKKKDPNDRNGDGRVGFRESVRGVFRSIGNAAEATGDNLSDFGHGVKSRASDVKHHRPLVHNYVTIVRKGAKVDLIYCDSRLEQNLTDKDCEKLHKKSLKFSDIKTCLGVARDADMEVGMRIYGKLQKYKYSERSRIHFHAHESKPRYRSFVQRCEAHMAQNQPLDQIPESFVQPPVAPAKPEETKPDEANPEFKPIEPAPATPQEPQPIETPPAPEAPAPEAAPEEAPATPSAEAPPANAAPAAPETPAAPEQPAQPQATI